MAFHERHWSARVAEMGDRAEDLLDKISPLGKMAPLGWNRPPVHMKNMEQVLRHLPDRYAADGYLVEAMGLGRDDILKLKLTKYEALKFWNGVQPVYLFVYHSKRKEYSLLPWGAVKALVAKARRRGIEAFHDDNEYYPIEYAWFAERDDIFTEDV